MFTLFGFICLGFLVAEAYKSVKNMLSPEKRQLRKEADRVMKETDELLGRKFTE